MRSHSADCGRGPSWCRIACLAVAVLGLCQAPARANPWFWSGGVYAPTDFLNNGYKIFHWAGPAVHRGPIGFFAIDMVLTNSNQTPAAPAVVGQWVFVVYTPDGQLLGIMSGQAVNAVTNPGLAGSGVSLVVNPLASTGAYFLARGAGALIWVIPPVTNLRNPRAVIHFPLMTFSVPFQFGPPVY